MEPLSIAFIQFDIQWENVEANLSYLKDLINKSFDGENLIVLPEMFSTGFSMEPQSIAENESGPAVLWMQEIASKHKTIVSGSIIFSDGDQFFNRFLFVDASGILSHYDKRHLYSPAGEHEVYAAGTGNTTVNINGWKVMPQICYDLRFPAWSRNSSDGFDLLLYVASWPKARIKHWQRLLAARAIENQSYCLGVNRIGEDGNRLEYNGHSVMYDYNGDIVSSAGNDFGYFSVELPATHLEFRQKLNFLSDRDQFHFS